MAIENFKHLIEAQSLEKKMKEHLDAIEEQKKRVLHIENLRLQASTQKDDFIKDKNSLCEKLSDKEKLLFEAEAKVHKTNEHIPLARNENEANALEKELDSLNPLVESLQEEILDLMEQVEQLENKIEEKEEFLLGSQKSLKNIKDESDKEVLNQQSHILTLKERVNSLLEQADENYKTAYLISNEKHKFNNPLCFVENNACHVCRYTLNQIQANEIEKGIITESCPGCGRLLTPLSAKTL